MRICTILFITLFVLCSFHHTNAQRKVKATIGIGLLEVSLNHDIPLYRDAKATEAFDTLRFLVTESGVFQINTGHGLKLRPISHYQGDTKDEGYSRWAHGLTYLAPRLVFTVVDLTEDGYQIVLNEKTRTSAIIKNDSYHKLYTVGESYWNTSHHSGPMDEAWFLFETWETYLKRLMYVELVNEGIPAEIYDTIGGVSLDVEFHRNEAIVTELNGYWARIEEKRSDENHRRKPQKGWIRWTDGKKVRVRTIESVYF